MHTNLLQAFVIKCHAALLKNILAKVKRINSNRCQMMHIAQQHTTMTMVIPGGPLLQSVRMRGAFHDPQQNQTSSLQRVTCLSAEVVGLQPLNMEMAAQDGYSELSSLNGCLQRLERP